MEHLFAEFYKALLYAVAAMLSLMVFIHQTYQSEDMKELIASNFREGANYYRADAENKDIEVHLKNYAAKGDIVEIPNPGVEGHVYIFRVLASRGTVSTLLYMGESGNMNNITTNQYEFGGSIGSQGINYTGSTAEITASEWGADMHTLFGDAIQESTFTQKVYKNSKNPDNTYTIANFGNFYSYVNTNGEEITRYARLLDIEDIKDYYKKQSISENEIIKLVFGEGASGFPVWLSSCSNDKYNVFMINSYGQLEMNYGLGNSALAYLLPVIDVDLGELGEFSVTTIEY